MKNKDWKNFTEHPAFSPSPSSCRHSDSRMWPDEETKWKPPLRNSSWKYQVKSGFFRKPEKARQDKEIVLEKKNTKSFYYPALILLYTLLSLLNCFRFKTIIFRVWILKKFSNLYELERDVIFIRNFSDSLVNWIIVPLSETPSLRAPKPTALSNDCSSKNLPNYSGFSKI